MSIGGKQAPNIFATASDAYARGRPLYPEALFQWIAQTCREQDDAWDCATGNGQAAVALARYFSRVEATDISSEQIRHSFAAPNIHYSAQPAEATDFADSNFDLIAVAQAIHWFDQARFWPEVRRVARPEALFCAWGYAWFRGSHEVQEYLLSAVARLAEPFWAQNNQVLWRGYRPNKVQFPFRPLATPALSIEVEWSLDELIAYVRTWSAFRKAVAAGRGGALERVLRDATIRLGLDALHRLSVPISILAGFVE